MTIKRFTTALLAAALLATPAVAGFKKIRTEADYRKQIVGKTIVLPDGSAFVIKHDGTLKGKTGKGQKVIGAWNWQGRYWCRAIRIGSKEMPQDCQTVEIDGNTIRGTRKKGKGSSYSGVLK